MRDTDGFDDRRTGGAAGDRSLLEGEVLDREAPGPRAGARSIRDPGWVGRNRDTIERGRDAVQFLMPFLPPPLRLGAVAASLAAQGLLTVEDARTGRARRGEAGLTGLGLALDAATLLASTRAAPVRLVRQAGRLAVARAVVARFERRQEQGAV
ncbi:MAG: hypothetical protein AAF371_16840 [Pseudomonadota bacterium]